LLKWLPKYIPEYDYIYIPKPPKNPFTFTQIFIDGLQISWLSKIFGGVPKNLYQLSEFLENKTKDSKYLVVLLDEAHEADIEVLEWLRVLSDQAEKMIIVLSGLPVLEDKLKNNLETLRKRIAAKIDLVSLTKEDTKDLINKRLLGVGGKGNEFSPEVIDYIYENTGGFPREIIRLCNELVNKAIERNKPIIDTSLLEEKMEKVEKEEEPTLELAITGMQREILEKMSIQSMTPGQVADSLDLSKYKSRQHAVRSVNNILKDLLAKGFVERKRQDKTFVYSLAPRLKTMFVAT